MRIRHANLIRKIALIYAVCDGAEQIGDEHLAAAMAMIDWMWKHVRVMLGTWGTDIFNMIEEHIVNKIREKGPMDRRLLWHRTKNTRRYNIEQWTKTFDAMVKTGVIAYDPTGVYFLVEPEDAGETSVAVS